MNIITKNIIFLAERRNGPQIPNYRSSFPLSDTLSTNTEFVVSDVYSPCASRWQILWASVGSIVSHYRLWGPATCWEFLCVCVRVCVRRGGVSQRGTFPLLFQVYNRRVEPCTFKFGAVIYTGEANTDFLWHWLVSHYLLYSQRSRWRHRSTRCKIGSERFRPDVHRFTNYTEWSPFGDANIPRTISETLVLLCSLKVHCHFHKNLQLRGPV